MRKSGTKPLFVAIFLLSWLTVGITHTVHDETYVNNLAKLRKDLLKDYDIHSRPVLSYDHTVNITIRIVPTLLVYVDENRGTMDLDGWIIMSWDDAHLKWNPKEYGGISKLNLPSKDIWIPDLKMYRGRSNYKDFTYEAMVLIFENGRIMWVPPATFHTSCDFTKGYVNYPRDTHNCSVKIGSWTYDGFNMNLIIDEKSSEDMLLEEFHDVYPEWNLTSISVARNDMYYNCCAEPYPTISLDLTIKRKGIEDAASGIILSVSGIIVLLMFWLPPTTVWKLSFPLVALMMQVWSSMEIVKITPSVAALPFALQPVKTAMIISVVALIIEVIIVLMATCTACNPPSLLSSVLRNPVVSRCFCSCNESSPIEAMESTKPDSMDPRRREWYSLSKACDRFAFLFFLIVFLAMAAI